MKKLFLFLMLICTFSLTACSGADVQPADTDDAAQVEDVGEVSQALCANYPTGIAGDAHYTNTSTWPITGYITKIKPNAAYADKLDFTHTNWTTGATNTTTINFGAYPVGNPNILFAGAGWTGSLANPATKLNYCQPQGASPGWAPCDHHVCMQGADKFCFFVNDTLAFTTTYTPGTQSGSFLPPQSGGNTYGNGLTGVVGRAPGEPSRFRFFYDGGGGGSSSKQWSLLNGTTCP